MTYEERIRNFHALLDSTFLPKVESVGGRQKLARLHECVDAIANRYMRGPRTAEEIEADLRDCREALSDAQRHYSQRIEALEKELSQVTGQPLPRRDRRLTRNRWRTT